jgi:hypothetical protein
MNGDHIQKAIDDYMLMERKARAWDELRAALEATPDQPIAPVILNFKCYDPSTLKVQPIASVILNKMQTLIEKPRGE